MAVALNGTDQRLDATAGDGSAQKTVSISAWFKADAVADAESGIVYRSESSGSFRFRVGVSDTAGANEVKGFAEASGVNSAYSPSSVYTDDTWTHTLWTYDDSQAATSRWVVYVGGSSQSMTYDATASGTSSSITDCYIGGRSSGTDSWFTGSIAEIAEWNVVLTSAEAAVLAAGYCPLFVRPQSLVRYWPLLYINDPVIERIEGATGAFAGTPTEDDHPRIIYPAVPMVITAPAAAAAIPDIYPIGMSRRMQAGIQFG